MILGRLPERVSLEAIESYYIIYGKKHVTEEPWIYIYSQSTKKKTKILYTTEIEIFHALDRAMLLRRPKKINKNNERGATTVRRNIINRTNRHTLFDGGIDIDRISICY